MKTKEQKQNAMRMMIQIKNIQSSIRHMQNAESYIIGLYVEENAKFKNGDIVMRKEGDKKTYRIINPYFTTSNTINYYAYGNHSSERFEEEEIKLVKNYKH